MQVLIFTRRGCCLVSEFEVQHSRLLTYIFLRLSVSTSTSISAMVIARHWKNRHWRLKHAYRGSRIPLCRLYACVLSRRGLQSSSLSVVPPSAVKFPGLLVSGVSSVSELCFLRIFLEDMERRRSVLKMLLFRNWTAITFPTLGRTSRIRSINPGVQALPHRPLFSKSQKDSTRSGRLRPQPRGCRCLGDRCR